MKLTAICGAAVGLLLAACNADELESRPRDAEPLQLSSPAIGQMSRFVRIRLAAGDSLPTYYPDTLELRVVETSSQGILVEESLSEFSDSRNGQPGVSFPEKVIKYRLSPKPATLDILTLSGEALQSRLFPQLDEQSFSIGYGLRAVAQVDLQGLRINAPYLPLDREYTLDFATKTQGSAKTQEQEVAVLYHEGRDEGLPGFTFVHSRSQGLHFMLVEHDLAGNATGWQQILDR